MGVDDVLLLQLPSHRPDYNPNPALLRTLAGHTGKIRSVSVTPDGRRAVSAGKDKTLRVWVLETGQCLNMHERRSDWLTSVSLTPDDRHAVSSSWARTLQIWDLESRRCVKTLRGHPHVVKGMSLTPDGKCAVSAAAVKDETLRVRDLKSGQCIKTLAGHTSGIRSVGVTPDGKFAISAGVDKAVRVWGLESGECIAAYSAMGEVISVSQVRADGRFVCSLRTRDVIILTASNLRMGPPVVSPVRFWSFGTEGSPGHWEDSLKTTCPWCGKRFPVKQEILGVITAISRNADLSYNQSPCLKLPEQSWAEPRLLSQCPHCQMPLRFNPFIVDNRGRNHWWRFWR